MKKLIFTILIIIILSACVSTQQPILYPTEQPKESLHGGINTTQPNQLIPSNTVQLIDINDVVISTSNTIQKCLDVVKPEQTCLAGSGIYNEALTLKTTGTTSQRINLKCETVKGCTINSGNARTLVTSNGAMNYTIDGFRFISTIWEGNMGGHPQERATVNFSYNTWWNGYEAEQGSDGFILRNCYVEGSVWIYGSGNIIENCEFNGTHVQSNRSDAISEAYAPSENNIFRNNVIHDYSIRGGWSLQLTRNSLWEGNTIYNIGATNSNLGLGIDCDGAGSAVYDCNVKGNTFYNNNEACILLENTFDSLIESNTCRDSRRGISVINYNVENGDGFFSDNDYQDLMTNTVIRNNTITNMSQDGFLCKAVRGNQFINNTIINVATVQGYFGALAMAGYNGHYCYGWTITGNIVTKSPRTVWYENNPQNTINNNFYDNQFLVNIYMVGPRTFAQWQAMGFDVNSVVGVPVVTPTFTRTPSNVPTVTVTNISTPTSTKTVTSTRTSTITVTQSQTRTVTPTIIPIVTRTPTPTPINNLCAKIMWNKPFITSDLSIRPSASLNNIPDGSYEFGKVIPIEAVVINGSGTWAQVNRGQFFAMKLSNVTYAIIAPCK